MIIRKKVQTLKAKKLVSICIKPSLEIGSQFISVFAAFMRQGFYEHTRAAQTEFV